MKWFRAGIAQGSEKIDTEKGIIFGVAVNTEGEAKGHGVHLDKEFVEECTKQGNGKKSGLKCRFGHPNMSSTAFGTFLGRYKNFRTEYNKEGKAVSKADLHLSDSAKKAPGGDLYSYVLEMAEKEPDMFGTSIVFTRGRLYRKDKNGTKAFQYIKESERMLDVWYEWDSGKKLSREEENTLSEERYVELKELHQNDVVDEPAANPDGMFSAFSQDQIAAKVTQFLDENEKVFELFHDDEIRESFLEKYESYKKEKKQTEVIPMDEENQEAKTSEEEKSFFSKLFQFFKKSGMKFDEEAETENSEAVETAEDESLEASEEAETEDSEAVEVEQDKELSAKVENLNDMLAEKDEEIKNLKSEVSTANKKLSALSAGLNDTEETVEQLGTFKTWDDAISFQMNEKEKSFDEAWSFCLEHHSKLYPAKAKS
jgi:hypothetical protein